MSSEDQELLAKISQLAGHINRHKNQQAGIVSVPSQGYSDGHAPFHRSTFYPRGGGRGRGGGGGGGPGYRVQKPAPFRNRTLVLNGSGSRPDQADGGDSSANSEAGPAKKGPSWVARTDRHMQLINSEVYEKDAQARAKAIEQTRLQKQRLRDERERTKLRNHFRYLANGRVSEPAAGGGGGGGALPSYHVVIEGIPFSVAKNGSKLVKVAGDPNPPSSTPKTAIVGGVRFYRSKNGNLYRHGVVKAQRRAGAVKKIDEPCRTFSTTGSCSKGPFCRYMHDPNKVAACKDFLLKGDCASGDDCDLSHDLTPERTPFCLHFAKGNCTNARCPYTHSQVSLSAPVCRAFGLYGYCSRGADCTERHVFECPDFSNTGVCKIKGCKLPHRERASFMRRSNHATAADAADAAEADLVDVSSDESVNSDDVDSDEVDEFVGADGEGADLDFVTQKDYIEI